MRVPLLSGNAIRGVLRRLIMRDMLDRLGIERITPKLHHALFTGGILESTDETSGDLDLKFRTTVREVIPPLALFGTAVGNQMIPSCLKVDHGLPICAELKQHACSGQYLVSPDDPRFNHSVRTFTDFDFITRRDDLRADREEDEQARQMKVEYEYIIPGAGLMHGFTLVNANDIERSCLGHTIALWKNQPFVGGKSGSGNGQVACYYEPELASEAYLEYLDHEHDEIKAAIHVLASKLGETL